MEPRIPKSKIKAQAALIALPIIVLHGFKFPKAPPEHLRGTLPPEYFGEKPRGTGVCWSGVYNKTFCCDPPGGNPVCWDGLLHTYDWCCREKVAAPTTPEEVKDHAIMAQKARDTESLADRTSRLWCQR